MRSEFDLTETEFRILRNLIHDECGLLFNEEKHPFLRRRLYPRLVQLGLRSFTEYIQCLKFGTAAKDEFSRMVSLLTNNETYFFRELPQLEAFRNILLPELSAKKSACGDKTMRILSAGCSTGEEAYTLAMLAFEAGCFFWGWDFKVLGLDIDTLALETARRGVYYERSFRMTDPELVGRFFTPNGGDFEARETIRRMVEFLPGNIAAASTWEKLLPLDMIFCRNVLIYFSEEKLKETLRHFHSALRPGGYLLLGHSETLTRIYGELESVPLPKTVAYRKREHPLPGLEDQQSNESDPSRGARTVNGQRCKFSGCEEAGEGQRDAP